MRRPEAYLFMGALLLTLAIPVMSSSTTAIPAATSVQTLLDRGRYADAELAARRLLRSQEGIHGSESLEAAEALDLLAESRISGRKAREPETREICERALRIKQRVLVPNDSRLGLSFLQLGTVDYLSAAYQKAAPLLENAVSIFEGAGDRNRPDLGRSLVYLAILRTDMGEDTRSREILNRALSILESDPRSRRDDMALAYNALGAVLYRLADYAGSITAYEHSISLAEGSRGVNDPSVGRALFNLGGVLYQIGDIRRSRDVLERSLRIREKAFGPRADVVGSTLLTLGAAYEDGGELARARRCYESALRIREESRGPEDERIAYSLLGLARIATARGDLPGATALADRAVSIRERAFGPRHWLVADALARLGSLRAAAGDSAGAASALDRTVEIQESSLGLEHPELGATLVVAASFHARYGLLSRALDEALRAEEIGRKNLRLATQSLPEHMALSYAGVRWSGLGVAMRILRHGHDDPGSRRRVWDALIRSRSVVLDETAGRLRAAAASQSPETRHSYADLLEARRRLASLVVAGMGEQEGAREYRARLERARRDADQAERALGKVSASSGVANRLADVGADDVAGALPERTALISYALCDSFYTVFILSPGKRVPESLALGPQREVDSLVDQWAAQLRRAGSTSATRQSREERQYRTAGTALRKVVLDPVLAKVQGAGRLLVVPDGALHLVSFYSLPSEGGGYLVEKDTVIHELSTERDLMLGKRSPASAEGPLLVGGAQFDAAPGAIASNGSAGNVLDRDVSTSTASVGRLRVGADCGDIASIHFEPLPGSLREVKEIASLWHEVNGTKRRSGHGRAGAAESGDGAIALTGLAATEGTFKEMAPGRRLLHIATHSFFLNANCGAGPAGARGIGGVVFAESRPKTFLIESPLLRSGLAFTGANRHRSDRGGEDGVLTADEIAALDLSSVEWAVLSGCDTGGGELLGGEGVLGLRRAFHVAGVRTLILSLWPVEDEFARNWMRRFYRARWLQGRGTADAVKEASYEVLRDLRAQGRSTEPSRWAAFVASGDWN